MRDHSHSSLEDNGVCEHCGQLLPVTSPAPSYGRGPNNRVGLAVTLLLHLLLVVIYLFQPETERQASPPSGATMVLLAPLAGKPMPKPASKPTPKQPAPVKPRKAKQAPVVPMQRLPDTITLPDEKPVELARVEPKPVLAPPEPPQEVDMSAHIEARRRQRGAAADAPPVESENERASRIAKANIAAANGRSRGDDSNGSGGVFSLVNKTFHSADLKFRGWNPNFKRRWLQQVTVEVGSEPDLETAVIKKMIELIRKEKTGDFDWDSQRLQQVVRMSARPEHTAELSAFLFKEMFPEYRPGPGAGRAR